MSHQHDGHESPPSFWSSRYAIGYVAIGAVAAYFLLTEGPLQETDHSVR